MSDPLSLLRRFNIEKRKIHESVNNIIFDKISWPKNIKTNFLKHGSGKNGSAHEYYTLQGLLFFLKNADLDHKMYMCECVVEDVPPVDNRDRAELLAYLNGLTDSCSSIDQLAFYGIPNQVMEGELDKPLSPPKKVPRAWCVPEEADGLKSLSETMTVEKIAAIKAKRFANRMASLKMPALPKIDPMPPRQQPPELKGTAAVLSYERPGRDRNKMLSSRRDMRHLLDMIDYRLYLTRRDVKRQQTFSPIEVPPKKPGPLLRYNRYQQERFVRDTAVDIWNIDTTGTFQNPEFGNKQQDRVYIVSKTQRSGFGYNPNRIPLPVERPFTNVKPKTRVRLNLSSSTPIIIVPDSNTSMVNILNVRDLLEQNVYVPVEKKLKEGIKRAGIVPLVINHNHEGDNVAQFEIVDRVSELSPEDWYRVVGVFVMGPVWQFDGWPWNSNPLLIFNKIPAFAFRYMEIPPHKNVANWPLIQLKISTETRVFDRRATRDFWYHIYKFIKVKKPFLKC